MKFKIEIFQILIASILLSGLFMAFIWICIHYELPSESFKEAISITVSFMSVIATIDAALIAVLLFNDWKVQHNKNLERDAAFKALSIIESQHFPLKRLSENIIGIRGSLKKGLTLFEKDMSEHSDPEFIERVRYNTKVADFLSDDKITSPLVEAYIEKFSLLRGQTQFYISIHNESKRALNLNPEATQLRGEIYEGMEIMKPNSDEPVPYEQKAQEYNQAFEKLSEHLFQKGKA